MIIIPAIDLKDGNVVRLFQGKLEATNVYSHSPVTVARRNHGQLREPVQLRRPRGGQMLQWVKAGNRRPDPHRQPIAL